MRSIQQSKDAKRAMIEIYAYTKIAWGAAQAGKYAKNLYAALRKLAQNPNLGHMRPDISSGYFAYNFEKHLIIYRADNKILYIIAILHQAMDINAKIKAISTHYTIRK